MNKNVMKIISTFLAMIMMINVSVPALANDQKENRWNNQGEIYGIIFSSWTEGDSSWVEGYVDNEARTITFDIPVSKLDADGYYIDEVYDLWSESNEIDIFIDGKWIPLKEGEEAKIKHGMFVRDQYGSTPYRILFIDTATIRSKEITRLSIEEFPGRINQNDRTISFHVPNIFVKDGKFSGKISVVSIDSNLEFNFGNGWVAYKLGDVVEIDSSTLVRNNAGEPYKISLTSYASDEIYGIIFSSWTEGDSSWVEGYVDNNAKTITFDIPANMLDADGYYIDEVYELWSESNEIDIFIDGKWVPLKEGEEAKIKHGMLVRDKYGSTSYKIVFIDSTAIDKTEIVRLAMDDYVGRINQNNQTITFDIPENKLENGTYQGIITTLEAGSNTVKFWVANSEWSRQLGDSAAFSSGDKVYVEGGKEYTLVINATTKLIHSLIIGDFAGSIDHNAATITFRIPENQLQNGHFRGTLTEVVTDEGNTVRFWVANSEWPLSEGDTAGFSSGDKVYVADGKVYTIKIIQ